MRTSAYARAIERSWSLLLDRPVVLSPKDWSLISDWHTRGVPLQIVDEAIQAAREKPGRPTRPRGLAYIAPAVEESWRTLLDGRARPDPSLPRAVPHPPPIASWRERLAAEPPGSPLRCLLGRLIESHDSGESPDNVDGSLDKQLVSSVAPGVRRRVQELVDNELEPFRERMGGATFDETRRRAVVARLRRELCLPSLAESREVCGD